MPVTSSLLSKDGKAAFVKQLREDYEKLRAQHAGSQVKLLSLEAARANAPKLKYDDLPKPEFTGVRTLSSGEFNPGKCDCGSSHGHAGAFSVSLEEVVPFIDWTPFFHTWELRGVYPKILQHEKHGEEATKLFADAQKMLGGIRRRKIAATARGLWIVSREPRRRRRGNLHERLAPAFADEVSFPAPANRKRRRHAELVPGGFYCAERQRRDCHPKSDSRDAVYKITSARLPSRAGIGLKEIVEEFKAKHDDYNAIMAEAIADRLAEAFAEYLHKRVRDEWGFGKLEKLTTEDLIEEKYRGIRPAAGYPACPDHTEKEILWDLLDVEKHTGIKLTESFAMWPGSSVSGLYFAHPESKYFAVGKLGKDQIEDYARRKGFTVAEAEKWLGPWLNYSPS